MLACMYDHQHRADFLGCATKILPRRFVGLEHVAQRDTFAPAFVDEEILLWAGDGMHVARLDQLADHSLFHRRGTNLAGVAERLEWHGELAIVHTVVLADDP